MLLTGHQLGVHIDHNTPTVSLLNHADHTNNKYFNPGAPTWIFKYFINVIADGVFLKFEFPVQNDFSNLACSFLIGTVGCT